MRRDPTEMGAAGSGQSGLAEEKVHLVEKHEEVKEKKEGAGEGNEEE